MINISSHLLIFHWGRNCLFFIIAWKPKKRELQKISILQKTKNDLTNFKLVVLLTVPRWQHLKKEAKNCSSWTGTLIWFQIRVCPGRTPFLPKWQVKSPICGKANTERHTTIVAPTSSYRITNYPNLVHVFGPWLEAAVSGEGPHRHGENMEIERLNQGDPGPHSCEVTVLSESLIWKWLFSMRVTIYRRVWKYWHWTQSKATRTLWISL